MPLSIVIRINFVYYFIFTISLILVCFRKLRQMSKKRIIIVGFHLLLTAILTGGCLVGGLSCRCITHMFGLVTLGLVLNASVVGPFLALSIVALTNIYLCYNNLQMR